MTKNNKEKKIEIIDTNKAVELLGITRAWFHQKYRAKLTRVPSYDNKAYYLLEEIKEIIRNREQGNEIVEPKYKIVE